MVVLILKRHEFFFDDESPLNNIPILLILTFCKMLERDWRAALAYGAHPAPHGASSQGPQWRVFVCGRTHSHSRCLVFRRSLQQRAPDADAITLESRASDDSQTPSRYAPSRGMT